MAEAWRLLGVASVASAVLLSPVHGMAEMPAPKERRQDAVPLEKTPGDWRHSLTKALTYQTIVVSTDQLLDRVIVTGTMATELEFFAANAVTGVGYYVGFDEVWSAAGFDPAPGENPVSVGKAVAYRVFDTARVLGITLALGTPIATSLGVTAAIAATRTVIYMLHDYVWYWTSSPHLHDMRREIAGWMQQITASLSVPNLPSAGGFVEADAIAASR